MRSFILVASIFLLNPMFGCQSTHGPAQPSEADYSFEVDARALKVDVWFSKSISEDGRVQHKVNVYINNVSNALEYFLIKNGRVSINGIQLQEQGSGLLFGMPRYYSEKILLNASTPYTLEIVLSDGKRMHSMVSTPDRLLKNLETPTHSDLSQAVTIFWQDTIETLVDGSELLISWVKKGNGETKSSFPLKIHGPVLYTYEFTPGFLDTFSVGDRILRSSEVVIRLEQKKQWNLDSLFSPGSTFQISVGLSRKIISLGL